MSINKHKDPVSIGSEESSYTELFKKVRKNYYNINKLGKIKYK